MKKSLVIGYRVLIKVTVQFYLLVIRNKETVERQRKTLLAKVT